jgi:hypothetical protein
MTSLTKPSLYKGNDTWIFTISEKIM